MNVTLAGVGTQVTSVKQCSEAGGIENSLDFSSVITEIVDTDSQNSAVADNGSETAGQALMPDEKTTDCDWQNALENITAVILPDNIIQPVISGSAESTNQDSLDNTPVSALCNECTPINSQSVGSVLNESTVEIKTEVPVTDNELSQLVQSDNLNENGKVVTLKQALPEQSIKGISLQSEGNKSEPKSAIISDYQQKYVLPDKKQTENTVDVSSNIPTDSNLLNHTSQIKSVSASITQVSDEIPETVVISDKTEQSKTEISPINLNSENDTVIKPQKHKAEDAFNQDLGQQSEQIFNNVKSVATSTANNSGSFEVHDLSHEIYTQLADTVSENFKNGKNEFVMQLNPVELGKVTVKIAVKNARLIVDIAAQDAKSQSIISSNSGELKSILGEQLGTPVTIEFNDKPQLSYYEDGGNRSNHQQSNPDEQQQNQNKHSDNYGTDFVTLLDSLGILKKVDIS